MAKHPNCEFIVAFAEGKEVEFKFDEYSEWRKVQCIQRFDNSHAFRIKPKTRMINGFEVPCAMDKEPEKDACYFYISFVEEDFYGASFYNAVWDKKNFQRGICFTNKEDAIAVAKAMLGIDPNS